MKYLQLSKTWLQRHVIYRARVGIWVVVDTSHVIIFPFLWLSVYGSRQIIEGYTRADIVTYYLLLAFIDLAAMSHIVPYLHRDILFGDLSGHLLKPVNYLFFRVIHELSYKIISGSVAILLFIIARLAFPHYFVLPHSLTAMVMFIISLAGALCLSFIIQFIVGFGTFWMGQTSALGQTFSLLILVFSGQIAPLVFFPAIFQYIAAYLPFKYLSYFPVQIYLGQIYGIEAFKQFGILIAWLIVLTSIILVMWNKGLKKYEGAGI